MPDPAEPWKGGYPTGTFMGLANLVLAQHALSAELEEDPDLHARVLLARGRATAALRRHALWVIGTPAPWPEWRGRGWPFYRLYALEKVCVFLARDAVGGLDWYREGTERILAWQGPDGGWKTTAAGWPTVSTSFALLFLLRDAESYRPVTPRPIGTESGPVTPRPEPEAPRAPAGRTALRLSVADAGLARLQAELAKRRADALTPTLDALHFVRRIYAAYRPEGRPLSPVHDAWCRRAEDVLLEAAVHYDGSMKADRDQRLAIALAALDVLGETSPRIGPPLMKRVLDRENDKTFPAPYRLAWYGAALDALRAVKPPLISAWLSRRCLSDDPQRIWRSVAALTALSGLAPGLSGSERRAAALGVAERLLSVERRSDGDFRWGHLQKDAAICLCRLAGCPEDAGFPVPAGARPDAELRAILAWIRAHAAVDDPTWR